MRNFNAGKVTEIELSVSSAYQPPSAHIVSDAISKLIFSSHHRMTPANLIHSRPFTSVLQIYLLTYLDCGGKWHKQTHLASFGEDNDVVSLGRLNVGPDVAELMIRNPARSLRVIRRRLFQHFLAVQCKVLKVRITGKWIAEVRHGCGCSGIRRRRRRQKVDKRQRLTANYRTDRQASITIDKLAFTPDCMFKKLFSITSELEEEYCNIF